MTAKYTTLEELEQRNPIAAEDRAVAEEEFDVYVRGYRLAELRRHAGLTQGQVAERVGVAQASISALEAGDISKSGLPTLSAYLHAIGATVEVNARLNGEIYPIAGDRIPA